jgi:hypothetical protein
LIGSRLVAITDNADPYEHLLVYDRSSGGGGQLICSFPLFTPFFRRNATENSVIGVGSADQQHAAVIIENNYGYTGVASTLSGQTTVPGIELVDANLELGICSKGWENDSVSVPNVVSQLSLATGLIYTYTKPRGPGFAAPWYFTAIDFATGQTVYQRLTGTGFSYDSDYAGLYLGPDGTGYVGLLDGIVEIRDQ